MSKNLLKSVICLALVAVFALAGISYADDSFEYHGYFRSGFSTNEKLNLPQGPMILSWPVQHKYRLGNETNNAFIEPVFVKNWKDDEGQWAKAVLRLDWHLKETHSYGNAEDDGGVGDITNSRVREIYGQIGGFEFAKDLSIWAGQRYYGREDVHINDLYYRDLTAFGAGVETKLGFGNLAIAWLTSANDGIPITDAGENVGKLQMHGFDFQLNDIKVPGGTLNVEFMYKMMATGDSIAIDDQSGIFAEVSYNLGSFLGFAKGFSKFVGQYGSGLGAGMINWGMGNFGSFGHAGFSDGSTDTTDFEQYRILYFGLMESGDLSLMPLALCQVADKGDGSDKQVWISAGFRVKYDIMRGFAMQAEIGHDRYDDGNNNPALTKITLAPTFTFDTGFWTRPEIRVYATYSMWDDAEGTTAAAAAADDSSAMQFGAQCEAWW